MYLKFIFISGKTDGNKGFKSDHLHNSGKRLHILLSLLFKSILFHGFSPHELLLSTIGPLYLSRMMLNHHYPLMIIIEEYLLKPHIVFAITVINSILQ